MIRILVAALSVLPVLVAEAGVGERLAAAGVPQEVTASEVTDFLVAHVPAFDAPESLEAWRAEAERLRREFKDKVVLQGVPESWLAPDPAVVWGDTIDEGQYRIRKLRYEALPGLWIPALLYEPSEAVTRVPAVLNVNGHAAPGKGHVDEQTRCINLALRGMLALHPEWLNFGELDDPEYAHGNLAYLDLVGVRGLSVFYLAMKRGVDVLAMDPRTDRDRIAMTGLSGGGWQTAVLSALDDRIDVIVPVAGHGAITPRIHNVSDIGDLEQAPSDMLTVGDYTHLTALFAPRPTLLIYNAKDNCCFLPEHTLGPLLDTVMPVYDLLNAGPLLETYINEEPGTHNYELDNRQQFYRFVSKHFLPPDRRVNEEFPCGDEILQPEELNVGIPEDNETFVTLARGLLSATGRAEIPSRDAEGFGAWQTQQRRVLAEVVRAVDMEFDAEERSKVSAEGMTTTTYFLRNDTWTLPAVHMAPDGTDANSVTIVLADDGMTSAAGTIQEILDEGYGVVALDPTFIGGNQPHESRSEALAMVMNATGDRLLGIQANQIAAVSRWVRSELGSSDVAVCAQGCNTGLASLVAVALDSTLADRLTLVDMPESLAQLIDEKVPYNTMPAVFCFGLLPAFDVPVLEALCAPSTVNRL